MLGCRECLFLSQFLFPSLCVHTAEHAAQPPQLLQRNQTGHLLKRFPPVKHRQTPKVMCRAARPTVTEEHMVLQVKTRLTFTVLKFLLHSNTPLWCSSWRSCWGRDMWGKPLFSISPTRCKHPGHTPSLTVIHYLKQAAESVINGKSSVFHLRDKKWVLPTNTCCMSSTNCFQRSMAKPNFLQ